MARKTTKANQNMTYKTKTQGRSAFKAALLLTRVQLNIMWLFRRSLCSSPLRACTYLQLIIPRSLIDKDLQNMLLLFFLVSITLLFPRLFPKIYWKYSRNYLLKLFFSYVRPILRPIHKLFVWFGHFLIQLVLIKY